MQFFDPPRLPTGPTSSSAQLSPMAQNYALCAKASCKFILTRMAHIGGSGVPRNVDARYGP